MAEKKKMSRDASSSSGIGGGNSKGESVVADFGRRRSSCGYCRSGDGSSITHGLWAYSLTIDDYQVLLDRGCRRSGCFLYKPEMERTCCPSYTIRLRANDFVPSKEQRRVLKRMQRYLDGTLDGKESDDLMDESDTSRHSSGRSHNESTSSATKGSLSVSSEENNKAEHFLLSLSDQIDNAIKACIESGEFLSDIQLPKAFVKRVAPTKRKLLVKGSEDLLYSCNISFQIVAALRRSKKDAHNVKLSESGAGENGHSGEYSPKIVAEILVSHLKQVADSSGLSIRACNGHINFYSASSHAKLDDIVKTDRALKKSNAEHDDKQHFLKENPGHTQSKRRSFEIRMKRSSFDPEEYSLYVKYQLRVHNDTPDDVTESSYRRFLVDTPLVFVPPTGDGTVPPCGFGSFHQQYLIDGRLVAVGVVDILPKCLSSKYLFWDPDIAFLSLGKFSALEEIKWIRKNQAHCPSLQYYYLGYYIHSCSKMRYKAAYRPSELLCPLRYQWILFDTAKPLLDQKKYVVLSDFASLQNGELMSSSVLENSIEQQHDDIFQEGPNNVFIDKDEEMVEEDSEDSGDESDPDGNDVISVDGNLDNLLIGLKTVRLRYKDLRQAIGSNERKYLETQMRRYMRVVGPELSERMVYSLG